MKQKERRLLCPTVSAKLLLVRLRNKIFPGYLLIMTITHLVWLHTLWWNWKFITGLMNLKEVRLLYPTVSINELYQNICHYDSTADCFILKSCQCLPKCIQNFTAASNWVPPYNPRPTLHTVHMHKGERDSSVVRVPDSWLKGRGFGGRIFFSRVNSLCWLLFRYPFHPRVTTVARKRSRSFCQKCRWQVTAKHAYTLPMWLWMKWHCNLVHGWMVYTELAPKRQHFT